MKRILSNKGSMSIETAICVTFFTSMVFVLMSVIQYIFVYSVSMNALSRTAEKISNYSCIFFKSGLDNVSGSIKAKVLAIASEKMEDSGLEVIEKLAEVGLDSVSDIAWQEASKEIFKGEIEKELEIAGGELFSIDILSMTGSTFFRYGNEFTLIAKVSSKYVFPMFLSNNGALTMTLRMDGNAWIYGSFSGYHVSDINVWELDNFKRGRVLENVFNSNLPESFPTIDIYDSTGKVVTMIISIDSTKDYYLVSGNLKKTITQEAKKLSNFSGASFDGVTINEGDYNTKKLLIVFPENMQTNEQISEVLSTVVECGSKYGIVVESASYQKSGEK